MKCVNLVCKGTAQAIALENQSELLTINIAGLAPGASIGTALKNIPLWRVARLTYVSVSGTGTPDDVSIELNISGIAQGGPWLGGELSPSNANACSVFSCEKGYCVGPIETAAIYIKNLTAANLPVASSIIIRVTYEYPPCDDSDEGKPSCKCEGKEQAGNTPVFSPAGGPVAVDPATGQPVTLDVGSLVKDEEGNVYTPDPKNPRILCRVSWDTGSCKTIVIPVRKSDGSYHPVGGLSCKTKCTL